MQKALLVLRREEIGVLFIAPTALTALALQLDDPQREAIHGIHYGGRSLTPDAGNHFRAIFPSAVHLAGYGNTLFGVVMEIEDRHREAMDNYLLGGPRCIPHRARVGRGRGWRRELAATPMRGRRNGASAVSSAR